jgi:uncharacterized protein (TIGR00255 family)
MSSKSSLRSMTGYAHRSSLFGGWSVSIDLRCVNSRYLDLVFRIPDELRAIEPLLREKLMATVQRGKLECRIAIHKAHEGQRAARIDHALLAQLLAAGQEIQSKVPGVAPLTLGEWLRWPGVLQEDQAAPSELHGHVQEQVAAATVELQASREREGASTAQFILQRVAALFEHTDRLREQAPAWIERHQAAVLERLQSSVNAMNEPPGMSREEVLARIRQEVVLYGLRVDVAEEVARIQVHLNEVKRVLAAGSPAGKRLDFLMQELNREANTLGSKAANVEVTQAAIECKLAIEQMREQVQNIE